MNYFRSNVFKKIMASYLILLILPITFIGTVLLVKSHNMVYENLQKTNISSTNKIAAEMNDMYSEIASVSISLQGWPAINKLFTMDKTINHAWVDDDELFNLVYVLRKQKTLHSYIDNIAIVFRDVDLVIDCDSFQMTRSEYFKDKYSVTSSAFHGAGNINWQLPSSLIPSCAISKYGQPSHRRMLYFKSIPNASGLAKAELMVTIKPASVIKRLTDDLAFADSFFVITDNKQSIILSNYDDCQKSKSIRATLDSWKTGSSFRTRNIGKKAYWCYRKVQNKQGCSYYMFCSVDNIHASYNKLFLFVFLVILFAISAGILMAFKSAKKNYAPLSRLVTNISEQLTPDIREDADQDEYHFIEDSMQYLSRENTKLKDNLQKSIFYSLTMAEESKLMNLLKLGDAKSSLAYASELLHQFLAQGNVKQEEALYIFTEFLSICSKVLYNAGCPVNDTIDLRYFQELFSFSQMNEYVLSIIEQTCTITGRIYRPDEKNQINEILSFIEENFENSDMTLTFLAEHFNVSALYISKAVKKYANINFIDYLHRLRIEKSKDYLIHSKLKIKEIALKTGYDTDKNYIRVFKKYEGITPGDYRKSNCA